MGGFPSGQWGQTVNLLAMPSVVRIHLPPPKQTSFHGNLSVLFFNCENLTVLGCRFWQVIKNSKSKIHSPNNKYDKKSYICIKDTVLNEYIFCTVNRVPDSYWTLSRNYDNVHIVPLKSLFAYTLNCYFFETSVHKVLT